MLQPISSVFLYFVPKWEKGIEYKMCVLILCATSFWNTYNSKKNSARYHNVRRSWCKVPVILVRL